jgi:hypothetical protein
MSSSILKQEQLVSIAREKIPNNLFGRKWHKLLPAYLESKCEACLYVEQLSDYVLFTLRKPMKL